MNFLIEGKVDIWVDEIVACLKENETGEIHETVVLRVESRFFLKKFQAEYLGAVHQYQFFINENHAQQLLGVYHYEWNQT